MHNVELIFTLTAALGAALVLGLVALWLKLPPIAGYLLAGVLLSPHTPGFVANRELAQQLAEVGVILLMFGVGLHFHWRELLAVRRIALTGAVLQIAVATALGTAAACALGWSVTAGIVFGIALSVASTVAMIRVLADARELQTQTGRIAIGWLIVEDVFTVFALVVLPSVAELAGGASANLPALICVSILKLAALFILTLWLGGRIIPWILETAAKTHSRELFTLTVLVIALGIAVASSELFGVSMALGAFLAGIVVGQSEFSYRAASEALPLRDAFAVLFFVSVGMLFDPQRIMAAPALTAAALFIVIAGKPIAAFFITVLLGYGSRIGLRVGAALAQIGEFSFMLVVIGADLKLLPRESLDSIVAVAIVSITLNPLMFRFIPIMERLIGRSPEKTIGAEGNGEASGEKRAVIVGYGPVGERIFRMLLEQGMAATVIELNIDTVRRLQSLGHSAVYGDAGREDVLKEAGIGTASSLIISAPATNEFSEVIRAARHLNPKIFVLARAAFSSAAGPLKEAGANQVFSGEERVASAMTDAVLLHVAGPE